MNDGAFEVEIGGLLDNEFDNLEVTGDATLTGDLAIELIDSFDPNSIDTFTILSATTLTGSFINVADGARLDTLGGEGSFLVSYDSLIDSVTLSDFLATILAGDFDFDGDVDRRDFLEWQLDPSIGSLADWEANYGRVASLAAASATVPEPTTCTLALAALCLAMSRRQGF